jgi:hypothetical protein
MRRAPVLRLALCAALLLVAARCDDDAPTTQQQQQQQQQRRVAAPLDAEALAALAARLDNAAHDVEAALAAARAGSGNASAPGAPHNAEPPPATCKLEYLADALQVRVGAAKAQMHARVRMMGALTHACARDGGAQMSMDAVSDLADAKQARISLTHAHTRARNRIAR